MNQYMNKELLVMELLIRKDSSSELASKRFKIRGETRDYIEVLRGDLFNCYNKCYFDATEISPKASIFFRSEKDIDAIFLKIQLVNKRV